MAVQRSILRVVVLGFSRLRCDERRGFLWGKKSESMSGNLIDSEVAVKSIERFLSLLATIPDPRRAEGKLYQLPHILLFSILAVVSGANSYRGIRTFIKVRRSNLNKACKMGSE